jgi:LVIVD repeat
MQRKPVLENHLYKIPLMRNFQLLIILSFLFLSACDDPFNGGTGQPQAYVPVYAKATDLKNIGVENAKPIQKPGKVYVIGSLLLQNDLNTGVHLINISNPQQPVKIAFLRVPFSTEISIKDNHLYVNNFNDLLVFNLSNPANPVLVKRLENVFPYHNSEYPPVSNTYFECVDPKKGIVIDWKLATVNDPKCRR